MSLEHLNIAGLEEKVGGRFKLVTLFQKRIRELQMGLPALVDMETLDVEDIVAEEIEQGKVWLATGEEADSLTLERTEEMKQMRHYRAARETEEAPPAEPSPLAPK